MLKNAFDQRIFKCLAHGVFHFSYFYISEDTYDSPSLLLRSETGLVQGMPLTKLHFAVP